MKLRNPEVKLRNPDLRAIEIKDMIAKLIRGFASDWNEKIFKLLKILRIRHLFCLGFFMSYAMNVYANTSDTGLGNPNQYVDERYVNVAQLADASAMFDQQGAQLIVIGEDQLIIIPTDQMFIDRSSVLKWSAYPFLDDLVNYLQNLKKVNLRVAVYSPRLNAQNNVAGLSEQQARSIADFIWNKGIDTRVMAIRGYDDNDDFPFIGKMSPKQFENGRIEIIFRELREYT